MPADDDESEVLRGMFEEIMKIISQKQVKVETILQRSIEQEIISRDSFDRMQKMLEDYGKKKQWT
ncbi:MAG TPA: hypothetical protein VJ792_09155 [Candidatus Nitrosotalea sp.]|nr:hypothetical protein [Candidatus Nitrosotalea sp.]